MPGISGRQIAAARALADISQQDLADRARIPLADLLRLEAYGAALTTLKTALENDDVEARLRGRPVQPVFRRTDSFNLKPVRR